MNAIDGYPIKGQHTLAEWQRLNLATPTQPGTINVDALDAAYIAVIRRELSVDEARGAMVTAGASLEDAAAFVVGHNLPSVRLMARAGGRGVLEGLQ